MKVLISNDGPFAHYYIRMGIARALTAMGHQVIMWDIQKKPAFDAFDELEPDLFIGQTYNLTDAIIKCIKERPAMRVIMKAADRSDFAYGLNKAEYPVLVANKKEIDNVMKLRFATGRPDFVYVHYHQDRLNQTHGGWEADGIKTHSLMNAADVFEFTHGKHQERFDCDVAFVGGRWGYKARTIDKYFMPLLNTGLKIKIFGNQPWGVRQYCGFLNDYQVKHLLASAKVCVNLSEPHSQDFGYDVVERPFKLASNRCFVVSDYVEDLEKIFGESMEYGKSPQEFQQKVIEWCKPEKINERMSKEKAAYEICMNGQTYFHRVRDIMADLDLEHEAKKAMTTFEQIKESLVL